MEYLKPKFTLPAGPRGDHRWPFSKPSEGLLDEVCEQCGAVVQVKEGFKPAHPRAEDRDRAVKRICFWGRS